MRLEYEQDEKTYWVDFKDTFSRGELKQWFNAQKLKFAEDEEEDGISENAVEKSEEAMLKLLKEWCSDCYFADTEGEVYNEISEITLEVLDKLDWGLLDFLFNIPVYARQRRGQLGELVGLPS